MKIVIFCLLAALICNMMGGILPIFYTLATGLKLAAGVAAIYALFIMFFGNKDKK